MRITIMSQVRFLIATDVGTFPPGKRHLIPRRAVGTIVGRCGELLLATFYYTSITGKEVWVKNCIVDAAELEVLT